MTDFVANILKPYLRITHDLDDTILTNLANSGLRLVVKYIDDNPPQTDELYLDDEIVQLCICMIASNQFQNGVPELSKSTMELPTNVLNLLTNYY
jgi:uncharacterized phage protein (predicted DNA packaging)